MSSMLTLTLRSPAARIISVDLEKQNNREVCFNGDTRMTSWPNSIENVFYSLNIKLFTFNEEVLRFSGSNSSELIFLSTGF